MFRVYRVDHVEEMAEVVAHFDRRAEAEAWADEQQGDLEDVEFVAYGPEEEFYWM